MGAGGVVDDWTGWVWAAWETGRLFCNRKLFRVREDFFTMRVESREPVPGCRLCFLAGAVWARGAIGVEGEKRYAQRSARYMMMDAGVGAKLDGDGGSGLALASRFDVP